MATTYKKNARNVYKVPLYAQFWAWWGLVFGLAVLSLLIGFVLTSKIVQFGQFGLWSLVAILTIWRAYSLTKSVIKAKTIGKYIIQRGAEKAVTKSLLCDYVRQPIARHSAYFRSKRGGMRQQTVTHQRRSRETGWNV